MYLSNQRQREKIRIVADHENETKQNKKKEYQKHSKRKL